MHIWTWHKTVVTWPSIPGKLSFANVACVRRFWNRVLSFSLKTNTLKFEDMPRASEKKPRYTKHMMTATPTWYSNMIRAPHQGHRICQGHLLWSWADHVVPCHRSKLWCFHKRWTLSNVRILNSSRPRVEHRMHQTFHHFQFKSL